MSLIETLSRAIARHRDRKLERVNASLERKLARQEREHDAEISEMRLQFASRIATLESELNDQASEIDELRSTLERERENTQVAERHRDATLDLLDRITWAARRESATHKAVTQQIGSELPPGDAAGQRG